MLGGAWTPIPAGLVGHYSHIKIGYYFHPLPSSGKSYILAFLFFNWLQLLSKCKTEIRSEDILSVFLED